LPAWLFLVQLVELFTDFLGFGPLEVALLSIDRRQIERFLHRLVILLLQFRFVSARSEHRFILHRVGLLFPFRCKSSSMWACGKKPAGRNAEELNPFMARLGGALENLFPEADAR